jgi:signal transduction histidine kinase
MRSESGELQGATAIAQDITLRKQAVEELRQARDLLEVRVEQRTEELRERNDQLRRLAAELTRGEQRERARMARLLHDHVQQLIVAAKMRVEVITRGLKGSEKEELDKVISLMSESLESSRSLAAELSPPVLSEGLAPALEWLSKVWMRDKHDLNVLLDLDRRIDANGEEMRGLVFLAVRELLFNVVKHAKVQEATVSLAANDATTLRVTVADGGKGFDPKILEGAAGKRKGLGLLTVSERIEMLGGTLSIHTADGEGVKAVILVPRGPDLLPKRADPDES